MANQGQASHQVYSSDTGLFRLFRIFSFPEDAAHGIYGNINAKNGIKVSNNNPLFKELNRFADDRQNIFILVLTNNDNEAIYGDTRGIGGVLEEFAKEAMVGLNIVFISGWDIGNNKQSIKRDIVPNAILLVSPSALQEEEEGNTYGGANIEPEDVLKRNKKMIQCFDVEANRGGLFVLTEPESEDAESIYEYGYEAWKKCFTTDCVTVDLAVPSKELLYRRLADVWHLKLKNRPIPSKNTPLLESKS